MFTLSDNSILRQLCIINIFKNPNIQSAHRDLALYNTTYSGLYNMLGFNHVINGVETYSEFDVLKIGLPPKQKMKQTKFDLPPLPPAGGELRGPEIDYSSPMLWLQ